MLKTTEKLLDLINQFSKYIYDYYSIIKKKQGNLPFVTIWMALERIKPYEISQTEKDRCYTNLLTCGI